MKKKLQLHLTYYNHASKTKKKNCSVWFKIDFEKQINLNLNLFELLCYLLDYLYYDKDFLIHIHIQNVLYKKEDATICVSLLKLPLDAVKLS